MANVAALCKLMSLLFSGMFALGLLLLVVFVVGAALIFIVMKVLEVVKGKIKNEN